MRDRLGNYQLIRLLGKSGLSDVYLGQHIQLRTLAAIKVLNANLIQKDVEQFRTEARIIDRLNHPNIIRILEFGVEGSTPFLVMDYARNGTLRQHHSPGTQVPLLTIVGYVKQIASALQFAHDQRLIHRDVKPENMLLGNDGQILLSDFELAVTYPDTTSGSPAGTARYMAPEQFRGEAVPASDQYSLGVVIYEWLCGRPPFTEGDFIKLAYQHSLEPPPPLTAINPTIPHDVEQVVMIALEKDPQSRFRNMRAFARAFEQASIPPNFNSPTVSFQSPTPVPLQFGAYPGGKTEAPLEDEENEIHHTFASSPPTEKGSNTPYGPNTPQSPNIPNPPSPSILRGSEPTFTPPPPSQAHSNDSGGTGFFTRVGNSLKNLLPRRGVEEQPETQLSLYALASARLEPDDHALIGKQYTLEAGLTQQRPANFVGEPFRVAVHNPAEPLLFHVMLHASPNIQLLGAWYQPLLYAPLNVEPQFITCPFRLIAAGESYLLINFYRERQWLKSIRLEFEGIKQTSFSTVTNWR
ncbi:MAG: serine/threonine protein kinase [Ktedonobacteraceae bacterium]